MEILKASNFSGTKVVYIFIKDHICVYAYKVALIVEKLEYILIVKMKVQYIHIMCQRKLE